MARSGVAAIGASCLLALATTLGGAEAQTTGSPLPLLQIDHAKIDHAKIDHAKIDHAKAVGKTPAHAHRKAAERIARTRSIERSAARHIASRAHTKTRVADAARDLPKPPAAPQDDSQTMWPTSAAAAPSVVTESVVDTDPNGILNGSHAVPAALPAQAASVASGAKPQPATASLSPAVKVAAAASAAPKTAVRAMLFKPSPSGPVGSASWLAHVLAALGGAIAAGAVAWLLIRPAPERTYS